ncbi:uncharacterized protein LOC109541823 [Dendroctonus ponderosae]|uniref:MARVEL domain-containing protein n=1 Tax=Dendroctonus ponderosae TaxID=77166 RepID=A0AAR5PZD4_DENPD|nr:uncharacterized protein LOC109541823 [Dendroctonus ponderosae]KAH0999066.1 hypothetical protein HUJ04_006061 [Dendroctonus ponderosae]KAH0999701.1 hypothetical protein HUJ04_008102 [Dendroctonus ponderosae]KAH0999702.1 hypothetical protein HUJ04_008103 [Dendroctonus ponderosae]KAH0999703.1 hypothetical protein HUJ04_008104 [Dendroctonus ponderosae]KAH1027276.1 hypothetical protein HUJ05_000818 [Dendroctonus ponderosae]
MLQNLNLSCYISLKSWAILMAFKNLLLGIAIIVGGSIWLTNSKVLDTFETYFACGVFIGIINIIAGCIMIAALLTGKEKIVLLYILLEFVILFTLTIFTAMNNLNPEISIVFILVFILCLSLWIGLYNVYRFYIELQIYNSSSVEARVDEITCQMPPNYLASFPEKAVDTTTV